MPSDGIIAISGGRLFLVLSAQAARSSNDHDPSNDHEVIRVIIMIIISKINSNDKKSNDSHSNASKCKW